MKSLSLIPALVLALLQPLQATPPDPEPETPSYLEPYQEFGKRIKAASAVSLLEGNMFGDDVSLYNGATTFSVVDVSVPGNSALAVEVRRRLQIEDRRGRRDRPGFANWEWDVPYLSGVFTEALGWRVGEPGASDQRCSTTLPPATVNDNISNEEIWHGTHVHLPGAGSEELLVDQGSFPGITSGIAHPWITKGLMRFRCKPSLNNPGGSFSGEGFIGVTPGGVIYTFDHMISIETTSVQKAWLQFVGPAGLGPQPPVNRRKIYLMATRIEDRFGNWVNYAYSGAQLTGISSNDGRSISITYTGNRVTRIDVQGTPPRTLSYDYGPAVPGYVEGTLTEVTLPDTSKWLYSFTGSPVSIPSTLESTPLDFCPEPGLNDSQAPYVLTMTHPSKLEGRFTFRFKRHYRNLQAPDVFCNSEDGGNYQTLVRPNYFDNWTLLEKRFSGGAMDTSTWTYDYGIVPPTIPCAGCPLSKTVTVGEPDGSSLEYVFGVRYGVNEGQLLAERTRTGSALRESSHSYATAASGYPDQAGQSLQMTIDPLQHKLRPQTQSITTQQGLNFTRSVNSFDGFARPLSETHASNGSPAFSRIQTVGYHDDYDIWVLAQEASRSVDGIAVHSTVFDANTARPTSVTEYGRLDRTMTWHSDGNLHQMRDALNRAFTLTNYERGVAKNIQLPTGPTISTTVDNYGNLLTVTDAVGFITSYQYDDRDRLSRIDYPDGDTVSWAPTIISTAPSQASEFGIPQGLWQRTETTGTLVKNTWFDARWRPILTRETVTDGSTNATFVRRRFDHRNREIFTSYPVASVANFTGITTGTSKTFDALDRLTATASASEIGTLSTSHSYPLGALRQVSIDARGVITHIDYQAYEAPLMSWPRRIVAAVGLPEQQTTEINRDVFGKPTTIRRSGNYIPPSGAPQPQQLDRLFVYDQHQRLCKTIEPESGTTVIDYNTVNDIAWTAIGLNLPSVANCNRNFTDVPSGVRSTHSFDAMKRLTGIDHPTGTNDLAYTYFADGALQTASNSGTGSNTWTYTYNKRRMLETEVLSYDNRSFALGHAYNALGHRSSLTYPSGQVVSFNPDARGRARQAGSHASSVSRHPNGAVNTFVYANGIGHVTALSLRQLPLRRTAGSVMDQWFAYDANANLIAIDDVVPGLPQNIEDRTLSYDGLNRLITADAPNLLRDERFRYDALDNIRQASFDGAVFDYLHTGERLTQINLGGAPYQTYAYNAQGDVVHRQRIIEAPADQLFANGFEAVFPARSNRALDLFRQVNYAPNQVYTFDRAHRLTNVQNVESYHYDAHGRRVGTLRATDNARHYQVYSQSGVLLHSEDRRINTAVDYIHLDNDLIAEREVALATSSVAIRYHHPDTRQSASLITNNLGQTISREPFAPYGSPYSSFYREGPGYAGHVTDSNTGLTYMQQRFYDPIAMRFLSPDPMAVDHGTAWNFNRYNYAAGNPYKFVDPDGRAVDIFLDIGFVSYSAYTLATEPSWVNALALGADVVGAIVPVATGLGSGVRAAAHGEDAFRVADEVVDVGQVPKGGAYKLVDVDGNVKRTGRSGNLEAREAQHARKPETKDLKMDVDTRSDDYKVQRGAEHRLYEQHPEARMENGGLNRQKAIRDNNPKKDTYIKADAEFRGKK